MKKIRQALVLALGIMVFATSFTVSGRDYVRADDVSYSRLEIEDMQLNKARIKSGSSDSSGAHVETYWQQDPLDTYDKLTDITFARTVLNAPEDGTYALRIHCKNEAGGDSITARLYVNGKGQDVVINGSSYTDVDVDVSLEKGDNAVILAWVNWGYFDYIDYQSDLSVTTQSTGTVYQAFESALNEVQLAPTSSFHNAKATLYTGSINYDSGDEEWQGSATFTVNAPSSTKSIDLHYYVSEYHNGKAELAMSVNGGKEVKITLDGTKTNNELIAQISGTTLESAGFKAGKKNTIKFRQSNANGGSVGLYYIELKDTVVEDDTEEVTTKRYEAEDAYIIAGAKIKTAESEDESWSKGGYVGEFTPANISKPSKIDEYCSNIGYIQYNVTADKAGYYKVTLGYATEIESMSVYVTSGYEWSKASLSSTGSWSSVGEEDTYVYLKKGENSIWVTGPASEDAWVNYDYIDLAYDAEGTIDTSKTVLFLDSGVKSSNSSVVDDEDAGSDSDSDSDSDTADSSDTSDTSPQTGVSVTIALVIAILALAGIVAVCRIRRLVIRR